MNLGKARNDLAPLKSWEVVLFGSCLTEHFVPNRSDVDVAVVTRSPDRDFNLQVFRGLLGTVPPPYDVKGASR
ncbi:MAG: hypothetical protein Kow0069_30570 [Promethearchaeota archaeon]